jgi:hypothetical protein
MHEDSMLSDVPASAALDSEPPSRKRQAECLAVGPAAFGDTNTISAGIEAAAAASEVAAKKTRPQKLSDLKRSWAKALYVPSPCVCFV